MNTSHAHTQTATTRNEEHTMSQQPATIRKSYARKITLPNAARAQATALDRNVLVLNGTTITEDMQISISQITEYGADVVDSEFFTVSEVEAIIEFCIMFHRTFVHVEYLSEGFFPMIRFSKGI